MSNPFKKISQNAKETQKIYDSDGQSSGVSSRKCEGCGAVRPSDTNLTTCDYCGFKFMNIESEIKVKE